MGDLSAVRDLVVVGVVGYVAYRILKLDIKIPDIGEGLKDFGESVYKAGWTAGEKLGQAQADLQTEAFMFEWELQNPKKVIGAIPKRAINEVLDKAIITVPEKSIFLKAFENFLVPLNIKFAWKGAVDISKNLWLK